MTKSNAIEAQQPASNIVPFYDWLEELGKCRATGHRWRKDYSWLEAGIVNVFGRLYIRRETIREFENRALAGELSKAPYGASAKWESLASR